MSIWLDPLRQALDRAAQPVTFFFRDDDAGWQDAKLLRLLDLLAKHGVGIDIAVIPNALCESLAGNLLMREATHGYNLRAHQHGFSHANHELEGRKHEFGPTRAKAEQLRDIRAGNKRLTALLGSVVDPIFTPPWNRCTHSTVECLAILGFRALSRDITAAPMPQSHGLAELPVSIDWQHSRNGVAAGPTRFGEHLAEIAGTRSTVGVMLHHAVMDDDDSRAFGELLELLSRSAGARCRLMRDLIGSDQHYTGVRNEKPADLGNADSKVVADL